MADFESFFEEQTKTKNVVYTRPFQLPGNVAFKIMQWQQVDSKFSKQKSQCVILELDEFVNLQVYPGSKFDNFDAEKVVALNEAIKAGNAWYLVARRWTSRERVPIDIVSEEKRVAQAIPVFDCDVHEIMKLESEWSKSGSSDDATPKKRKSSA